jgi:hypothetical protein
MKQDKIQELAEELWFDLADESDGWQTTMNYESFIKAIHKALTIPVVVGRSEQLVCDVCFQHKPLNRDYDGHLYCDDCDKL